MSQITIDGGRQVNVLPPEVEQFAATKAASHGQIDERLPPQGICLLGEHPTSLKQRRDLIRSQNPQFLLMHSQMLHGIKRIAGQVIPNSGLLHCRPQVSQITIDGGGPHGLGTLGDELFDHERRETQDGGGVAELLEGVEALLIPQDSSGAFLRPLDVEEFAPELGPRLLDGIAHPTAMQLILLLRCEPPGSLTTRFARPTASADPAVRPRTMPTNTVGRAPFALVLLDPDPMV